MSQSNKWVFSTNDLVGQQLLKAGKSLMKVVYDYDDNEPDYLPTSYKMNANTMQLTNYKHHVENSNTSMFWSEEGKTSYAWSCDEDKVLMAEFSDTNPSPAGFVCLTDCSGLVTGLLAYCNAVGKVKTIFSQWQEGTNVPNAKQYRTSFAYANNKDFKLIESINEVAAGDFIAFGYHTEGHQNTGHIMLIVATRILNDYQVEVVVMDESSGIHTDDTRLVIKDGKPVVVNGKHVKVRGIGMGKALMGWVIEDESGNVVPFMGTAGQDTNKAFLAFYWGDGTNHTLEYPIAIGRAVGLSSNG